MPRELLLKWLAVAEQIKQRNKQLNQKAVEICRQLEADGFMCCVLKGQGNAAYYPYPYSRIPGDIDIWLAGGHDMILNYVKKKYGVLLERYHHVEIPPQEGISIELHFTPSFMRTPWYNRRLQRWFKDNEAEQFHNIISLPDNAGEISVPTCSFNIVYQLQHLYSHFFTEGIGLRQFVDYYYLLKSWNTKSQKELERTLRHLGLWKFAGAVMYVMRDVFALEEQYMIAPIDERRGKTLLNEILKGGNFGQYLGLNNHNKIIKYFLMTQRNLRFIREYPAEALCEPVFRTWHFFWRMAHRS